MDRRPNAVVLLARALSALPRSAQSFARAYHLDRILGDHVAAVALYRAAAQGDPERRETALAHLRLALLARAQSNRAEAVRALDWLVSHARAHPALARRAERELVDLLHPQAGVSSVLTRGPLASFTQLEQVDEAAAATFRAAEQGLLHYVRVGLNLQIHNVDEVLDRKRMALVAALRRYDPLIRSAFPNAQAAALFRQGSLQQDFAEALGRARMPAELLPRMAARIRARLHGESVVHFRRALGRYRRVLAIRDVSADRWRRAATESEAQIGRLIRRR